VNGMRPKARYGHCMCRVDSRVLMFGGENNTSLANDLWTLRGLGLDGEEAPAWIPLELPGNAPAPRKGHSCTCEPSRQTHDMCCSQPSTLNNCGQTEMSKQQTSASPWRLTQHAFFVPSTVMHLVLMLRQHASCMPPDNVFTEQLSASGIPAATPRSSIAPIFVQQQKTVSLVLQSSTMSACILRASKQPLADAHALPFGCCAQQDLHTVISCGLNMHVSMHTGDHEGARN